MVQDSGKILHHLPSRGNGQEEIEMARVMVFDDMIVDQAGVAEYNSAVVLLDSLSTQGEKTRPVLNGVKMVDFDGRNWYGYDYDGASWWITANMAAPGPGVDPYEIKEQTDPSVYANR
jgi:hypothetical protein